MKITTEPVAVVSTLTETRTYRATVEDPDVVTIEVLHRGEWCYIGTGVYDDGIRGCNANLGDAVFEILEAAIVRALVARAEKGE